MLGFKPQPLNYSAQAEVAMRKNKPFPSWTLKNENAILAVIAKEGFASVQARVKQHIEENTSGTFNQAFWIDINRYLILLKNPLAFHKEDTETWLSEEDRARREFKHGLA